MSRIKKLPIEDWDFELRTMTLADEGTPLEQGLMRMIAHQPAMAKSMVAFSGALLRGNGLPRRLVELVRLRVAFHNQCRSCMAIRYKSAIDDGLTEGMVCSLERPQDALDLTPAEKAAIHYADLSSTDHLSITDQTFQELREHFSEANIVSIGMIIAFFIGYGRLAAAWHMTEDLPEGFQVKPGTVAPWTEEAILVRG